MWMMRIFLIMFWVKRVEVYRRPRRFVTVEAAANSARAWTAVVH